MGDRLWWIEKCPKCGQKTLECYEALSSLSKYDECANCDFAQAYDISDDTGEIIIRRLRTVERDSE